MILPNHMDQTQPTAPMSPTPAGGQKKNTTMAIVAYIIFFIPLLTDAKHDPFVKYHVKQGLALFLVAAALVILQSILSYRAWFIIELLQLGLLILAIMGIMNAAKGEEKPLPLLGPLANMFKF